MSECDGVIRFDAGRRHGIGERGRRGGAAGWVGRVRDLLRLARHARRTRRELAQMDDRMLSDIGISRADAYEEARRAPWDMASRPR